MLQENNLSSVRLKNPPAGGKLVKLFCAIVGEAGSAFSVRVDESDSVDDLKKAIADDQKYDFAASKLQLSLAKKGAGWLPSAELGAIRKGEDVPGFESVSLVDTEKVAYSTFSIGDVLKTNGMSPPQTQQIHVLVKGEDLPAPFPQWDSAPGQFPPLVFADEDPVISIPAAYAENSGLPAREDGLVLYLRNGV
ncbi:hypothetical protein P3T76_009294 [Phytophthora citrophthora]|uniref:Crinkler effector protein N-terminal domain-containing protein n=1 Tax=Phytophthora citrophthora TaxID=4793 RepID=A0AAD9GGL8_9STRA|nr:hypothetical protein P3T76_009294 [Phytophthora citrophthora]